VYCSLRGAPVDAVPGIFGRDVISEIPVLVYFLTAPAILLSVTVSIPTTIVTPRIFSMVVGRAAAVMPAGRR